MNMKRLIAVLVLLTTAVFAQWSFPPPSTYVPDSAVRAVRAGYLMNFSEDPLIDTGTVGWDSSAFKTWHATESLNAVTYKATRARVPTIYTTSIFPTATTTYMLIALTGSTALDSMRIKATVVRFDSLDGTVVTASRIRGDLQSTWKTLDTTAVPVLARANVFTGVTQTISGAVPTWRLIQTNDTSKWWIDATDTTRHYSNKPVVWSGAYRRFLNTTVIDSSTGPVIQATRLRGGKGYYSDSLIGVTGDFSGKITGTSTMAITGASTLTGGVTIGASGTAIVKGMWSDGGDSVYLFVVGTCTLAARKWHP
jgi:hypothetical protein